MTDALDGVREHHRTTGLTELIRRRAACSCSRPSMLHPTSDSNHHVTETSLSVTSRSGVCRVAALLARLRLAKAQVDGPIRRATRNRHVAQLPLDRKSVVEGKSVDLGGR